MSKTKRIGIAAASFLLAMIFAVAAFAFAGPASKMDASQAAESNKVAQLLSEASQDIFADVQEDMQRPREVPENRPTEEDRGIALMSEDEPAAQGEAATCYVDLYDGDTGEPIDYVYLYVGDKLYPSDIPVRDGKYLARVEGQISDFQEDTDVYLYYEDIWFYT